MAECPRAEVGDGQANPGNGGSGVRGCARARRADPHGLRRCPPPAGAHRIRPHRRRSSPVRQSDARPGGDGDPARHADAGRHGAARLGGGERPAACAARRERDGGGAPRLPATQRPRGRGAARVVGAGDARDAFAAHRADDAVLAQPLRVEPAEGALRAAHVRAERHAARARARQLRDAAARGVEGTRDAHLPRRRAEPAWPAQRELRARGDGALHAGRRAVHRAGHQGGGARVHRLERRPRIRAIPVPTGFARSGRQDRPRPRGPVRRRRGARRHPLPAADIRVHHAPNCGANSSAASPTRPK